MQTSRVPHLGITTSAFISSFPTRQPCQGLCVTRRFLCLASAGARQSRIAVQTQTQTRLSSTNGKPITPRRKKLADGDMTDYTRWTKDALVERLRELEEQLKTGGANGMTDTTSVPASVPAPVPETAPASAPAAASTTPKPKKSMDPSRYGTRFIALRIAYLGKRYGGFEYQPSGALPSVEEELWKALVKSCLIFPAPGAAAHEVDFNVCEYSKCGRTDKGVSAFGQVVALRVRSNRKRKAKVVEEGEGAGEGADTTMADANTSADADDSQFGSLPPPHEELQYAKLLNRLLPPDIRVLAWCPNPPPGFSARFSCRERQYRYFFTQPAYLAPQAPTTADGKLSNGWLDIEAMRTAAKHFEGLHDFRNFCKIDPNKQITNYKRRIFSADIVEVPGLHSSLEYYGTGTDAGPKVYSFDVRGSAFLWHQIRNMVAILFLVGQRLESPDLVPQLLDPVANPCRPSYAMAEEAPLVLWDCIFPPPVDPDSPEAAIDYPDAGNWSDSLEWFTTTEEAPDSRMMVDSLWHTWREAKMDEILANRLLDQVLRTPLGKDKKRLELPELRPKKSRVYEGGGGARFGGPYLPVLQRERQMSPEEQNDRFARQKGFASAAAMREVGNWRAAIREMKNAEKAEKEKAAEAEATEEKA